MSAERPACRSCGRTDGPLNVERHPFPERSTFICPHCYSTERHNDL